MKLYIYRIVAFLQIDLIIDKIINIYTICRNAKLKSKYPTCKFIGENTVTDLSKFKIGRSSCLKYSYIESSGQVEIGSYVHSARNLVIWSSNHIYNEFTIPRL